MLIEIDFQSEEALYMQLRNFDGEIENDKFVFYLPESAQHKEAVILKQASAISTYLKDITGKELSVLVKIGVKPTKETANSNLDAAFDLFS